MARSAATPLVCGVRGNRVDLTLAALHFRPGELEPLAYGELDALRASPLDVVVP